MAHATFDLIEPAALKALGVHALLGVCQERQVLVDGVGHGGLASDHVGVIKRLPLGSAALARALAALFLEVVGALEKTLLFAVGKALKRELVQVAPVRVGGVGPQPHEPEHLGLIGEDGVGEHVGLNHIREFFIRKVAVVGLGFFQLALRDPNRRLNLVDLAFILRGVEAKGLELHG